MLLMSLIRVFSGWNEGSEEGRPERERLVCVICCIHDFGFNTIVYLTIVAVNTLFGTYLDLIYLWTWTSRIELFGSLFCSVGLAFWTNPFSLCFLRLLFFYLRESQTGKGNFLFVLFSSLLRFFCLNSNPVPWGFLFSFFFLLLI